MEFVMQNLPIIICAVVGILLLIVEFFMPGFGLPGIGGLLLLLTSVVLTWYEHGAYAGLGATLVMMALSGIAITLSVKSTTSGRISRSPLILKGSQKEEDGYQAAPNYDRYLYKSGVAETVLRPAGIATIEGERINVVSRGGFINKGDVVTVEAIEGARILVKRVES
ncbi:MAG: serine protease [Clostridiales bacterium]|nr:serine protease [Clostridiales bacterium]